MTRRRKLFIVLGILGLLVVGVPVTLLILWMDESAPDDTDLLPQRLVVADAENAYTYYRQATRVLVWPCYYPEEEGQASSEKPDAVVDEEKQKAERDKNDLLYAIANGTKWDAAAAAEVLQKNKEALALLEKGVACRACQFPEVKTLGDMLSGYDMGYVYLSRLGCVRAEVLAHEGKAAEAAAEALKVIRLGDHMEQSQSILVTCLVGMTVKQMGMDSLRRIALAATLSPDQLLGYAGKLGQCSHESEGYEAALHAEYAMTWESIRVEVIGRMDKVRKEHGLWGQVAPMGWLFKPNATKRLLIDAYRPMIANASRPYAEAVQVSVPISSPATLTDYARGNITGQIMQRLLVPAWAAPLRVKCLTKTEAEVTRALLALKAFKLKTGRLPAALDELVPEYLPSVPLDDFSGKAIRYSPEKKILYSVGKDLQGVGGFTKDEAQAWWDETQPEETRKNDPVPSSWDMPNPSWPIDF